jgi:hypothetical protein
MYFVIDIIHDPIQSNRDVPKCPVGSGLMINWLLGKERKDIRDMSVELK